MHENDESFDEILAKLPFSQAEAAMEIFCEVFPQEITKINKKRDKMENLIKDFYCRICSLQFGNKIVFDMHQSIVHGIVTKINEEPVISENMTQAENKIIQCSICEATGASGRNLQIYIDSIHSGNKPYKCNTCDSSFYHKSNLNKHVSSVHEGKKQFICEICNEYFTQKRP